MTMKVLYLSIDPCMVDVPVGVVVVQIIGLECGTPTHPHEGRVEAGLPTSLK